MMYLLLSFVLYLFFKIFFLILKYLFYVRIKLFNNKFMKIEVLENQKETEGCQCPGKTIWLYKRNDLVNVMKKVKK